MDFKSLTGQALKDALPVNFATTSYEDLTAGIEARRDAAKALFALDSPTIAQVNDAKALLASVKEAEEEKDKREEESKKAGKDWEDMKASFSEESGEGEGDESAEESDEGGEGTEESGEGDESGEESDEGGEGDEGAEGSEESGEPVTASQKITPPVKAPAVTKASAASKVGAKTKRPARPAASSVVITAAADVPDHATGQRLEGMDGLRAALQSRTKGFPRYSEQTAERVRDANGGVPDLHQFQAASIHTEFDKSLVASVGKDYAAVQHAVRERNKVIGDSDPLVAAGWCAPSEPTYTYMTDYVVDGLLSMGEISAPRGGILHTTGPERAGTSQGQTNLDGFGFIQTEAEAEAGKVKPLEEIVCPEFTEHRLDAIGYGYTIPFLTQKAYPELVTDILRYASVMWQHKINDYKIRRVVADAVPRTFTGYGASVTDALEAISILAVKERRRWNLGRNATMEVKVPEWVREVYRMDISRRNGMRADAVTDQMIDAHFTARHLAVEFIADWQELTGTNIVYNATYDALVYPAGTYVSAMEDVVNLSAFYDTASVTVNQYTGVFFEQGILVLRAGYGSSKVTLPVNTAGEQGALDLTEIATA